LKPMIESMPNGPLVNLASANEHVPEIERRIRVVKERCRSCRHGLPFKQIPKLLTIHIVMNSVRMNLQSEIATGDLELLEPIEIQLTDSEKTQHSNEWRTCRERNTSLVKYRGQTCSLILGQCSQLLKDKMKHDVDWTTVSISYDPLTLYRLIEKTVLAQTEDQCPFATVYDQEMSFYSFRQSDTMSNPQWYERFNTKVDVGEAIGVTRQHKALLEHVTQEQNIAGTVVATFDSLTTVEQDVVRKEAEERCISYAFLRQSGPQHGKLKVDLQNDFTTGNNCYPKTRQQTLHLLDKHSKTTVTKPTSSEGASFAQGGEVSVPVRLIVTSEPTRW
jgi:hypothetical protein